MNHPPTTLHVADLFSGIGGLRLGFENAVCRRNIRTNVVLNSEILKKSIETYHLNFALDQPRAIREILDPPPFSCAGEQEGFGDTRGTLFFEIERIPEKARPWFFLLENVRGLTTHDAGREGRVRSLSSCGL